MPIRKLITFPFHPVTAQRMTQGQVKLLRIPRERVKLDMLSTYDRIKACLDNKKALVWHAKANKFTIPESGAEIIFFLETNKKERWGHQPHQQKPDIDNLTKQFFDALCTDDSHIWEIKMSKMWCKPGQGRIEVWGK